MLTVPRSLASPSSHPADHPFGHQPAFRAVVAAGPPLAELCARIGATALVGTLVIASSDLAEGFAAPPGSARRSDAHRRAWHGVREIDRAMSEARRRQLAPAAVMKRAQRAIDRADVLVGALLPS